MSDIEDMMQHLEAAKDSSTESEPNTACDNCAKGESRRREVVKVVAGGGPNRKGNKTEQRLTRRVCPECGERYTEPSY